jgi:ribonucleoside-diphosphate reductase beta chain
MTNQSILNVNVHPDKLFFGDSGHGIARYDKVRYPVFQKLNEHMHSLFWKPENTSMQTERKSYRAMTDAEQFVFTSNLKRQVLLDTAQGRAPVQVFGPTCTDPMLENCLATWQFFETIHSQSYTHILRAIYPDPSVIVDSIADIQEIADCAHELADAYDRMIVSPSKENLYLALIAANALEGVRFQVSFDCTFLFGQRGSVEGSANINRQIARDETQHLALTQHILKLLPKDDPEFVEIIADNRARAIKIYEDTAQSEYIWIDYLFSHGPILGLNEKLLYAEVDRLVARQLHVNGLESRPARHNVVLRYVESWMNATSVQKAPQETDVGMYLSSSMLANDLAGLVL